MTALKLVQIGNSVGVILPKEVLARLKLDKGDTVFVTDAAGGVTLTPYDPALDEQLAVGRPDCATKACSTRRSAAR
jgi:putative addiction module antidote